MKFPGGTVYEVENRIPEADINVVLDGHAHIRKIVQAMVEEFMERLPREKDAR